MNNVIAIFGLLTFVFFGLFYLVYRKNKTSFLSGFLFGSTILSLGFTYLFFVLKVENPILDFTIVAIAVAFFFVLLFGIYVLLVFLLLNARAMFKRERRSLANSLTLIAALGILALIVISLFMQRMPMPYWLWSIWVGVMAVIAVYVLHILLFLTTLLLCNFARPPLRQDYIIVLGSGLVEGNVSPLLARRVDRAIKFYRRQVSAGGKPPKLVMSGGQGADEPRSEAEAMQEYAMDNGIPKEDILLEDASANTKQNMEFSKDVMEKNSGGTAYACIFATSNYHLLRAGVFARNAGLKADGIGAPTAFYYMPTALMREYIGLVWMYRKRLMVLAACAFLFGLSMALLPNVLPKLL